MLVWLASYPRSGNSLLRQVLWQTMGYASYHDTPNPRLGGEYGRVIQDDFGDLASLQAYATDAPEPVFVKTHLPPADRERAIYVVRDGRSAISSFLRYERTFSPESRPTLLRLILGLHYFGGWSEHYDAWVRGRDGADTLVVRYDELYDADDAVLARIAEFLGHTDTPRPWSNPIDELRPENPDTVGEGRTTWEPSEGWDAVSDAAFWSCHGHLMTELDLDDGRRLPLGDAERASIAELVDLAREVGLLLAGSEEDAAVIQELSSARAELLRALDDAQALAAELERERSTQERAAAERGVVLEVERRASDELRREVETQSAAAAERLDELERLRAEVEVLRGAAGERLEALEQTRQDSAAVIAALTDERDAQAAAAAERLATIAELSRELRVQTEAATERAALVDALTAERDAQAAAAAERLQALEALDREWSSRFAAVEALLADRLRAG